MLQLILLLLAPFGPWHSSAIGGGGYIQNVVLTSDPNILYTYVDVGGLYRSDNGGRNWNKLHGALPPNHYEVRGVDVDPRNPHRIVVAAGSQWSPPQGIFVSHDGGKSFRRTLTAPFQGNGIFRWTGTILARDPKNPDVILAGTAGSGVFRSTDGGESWKLSGAEGTFATDLKFDPSNPNRAYLSAMPYRDWLWRGGASEMVDMPASFQISQDGGRTWAQVSAKSPSEIVKDTKGDRLIGIIDERPAVSTDAGLSWRPLESGLPPGPVGSSYTHAARLQALATGPDFVLIGGADGSIYRLQGDTWSKVERRSTQTIYKGRPWFLREGIGWALGSIVIDPRDSRRWFFTDWYGIYRSDNAGLDWQLSIDGIEATVIHTVAVDPMIKNRILMGMADNGAFVSEDRGERFELTHGMANNAKSLAFGANGRVLATGPDGYHWFANAVFLSDDRGKTFRRSPMTGLPDMNALRSNTVVSNGRQAWLGVTGPVSPGKGGPYVSVDGGTTWRWSGDGLRATTRFFRESIWAVGKELAISPNGSLVAISVDERLLAQRSPNGTWTMLDIPGGGTPFEVAADPHRPGTFLLGLKDLGGVLKSDDNGRTWNRLQVQGGGPVTFDPYRKDLLACASQLGASVSTDGGKTWRQLDNRLPHKALNTIALTNGRLIAGSSGSGVFWIDLP